MGERLRLDVLLVCPGCGRHVKPLVLTRHFIERETTAVTLPEFPLESGVISNRSLSKITVGCPMEECGDKWDVWPDEAGL